MREAKVVCRLQTHQRKVESTGLSVPPDRGEMCHLADAYANDAFYHLLTGKMHECNSNERQEGCQA